MNSPHRLHVHFTGRERILTGCLIASTLISLLLCVSVNRLAKNFSTPRIAVQVPGGPLMPVACALFKWDVDTANQFIQIFLPVAFSYSPEGIPNTKLWSPFIATTVFDAMKESWEKNRATIQAEGYHRFLRVKSIEWDETTETATVSAETTIISTKGKVNKTDSTITVSLQKTSDPLNAYGYIIQEIQ